MTGGCTPQDFQVWVHIPSNAFEEPKGKKYILARFRGKQPYKSGKTMKIWAKTNIFLGFGYWKFLKKGGLFNKIYTLGSRVRGMETEKSELSFGTASAA